MTDKQKIKFLTILVAVLFVALAAMFSSGTAHRAPDPTPKAAPTVKVSPKPTPKPTAAPRDFVLNNNSKRFHYPDCASVAQILEKNREDVVASRDELIARGFKPCGNCQP